MSTNKFRTCPGSIPGGDSSHQLKENSIFALGDDTTYREFVPIYSQKVIVLLHDYSMWKPYRGQISSHEKHLIRLLWHLTVCRRNSITGKGILWRFSMQWHWSRVPNQMMLIRRKTEYMDKPEIQSNTNNKDWSKYLSSVSREGSTVISLGNMRQDFVEERTIFQIEEEWKTIVAKFPY